MQDRQRTHRALNKQRASRRHRLVLGQISRAERWYEMSCSLSASWGRCSMSPLVILLATRWEGYSYTDQTVSELFAIGAPTRPPAVPLMLTYGVLAIAFGLGVWVSAGGARPARRGGRADRKGSPWLRGDAICPNPPA